MKKPVRFDESLSCFVEIIISAWGVDALSSNIFLRDASGRLTFVVLDEVHNGEARKNLTKKVARVLGSYVDPDGFAVATPSELFDDTLRNSEAGWNIPIKTKKHSVNVTLIDRRVVGADWLRRPSLAANSPSRIVFASLKGGVGRSTALCVLAAYLASRGRRVLTIDMDIEAPSLGNMILKKETLPEFGVLDYLVETGINSVDDEFFVDLVGHSWIAEGKGTVDTIPAIGQKSLDNPLNVLAKIARAYLDQPGKDGQPLTITDRMSNLLDHFAGRNEYDVILIDARAGLHETTAAAILGLGAEVLLFGLDQPQTYAAYEILFAHLGTLPEQTLRDRLHIVHAKVPQNGDESRKVFAQRMSELLNEYLWPPKNEYESGIEPLSLKGIFDIEWNETIDDTELDLEGTDQIEVLSIGESSEYQAFDPIRYPDSLTQGTYMATYGPFLKSVFGLIRDTNYLGQI